LEAGKLIDQSPSAIKLRLYQTLANMLQKKLYHTIPRRALPRTRKQKKRKDNTGTIIHRFLD
jgi:ribosomal protein L2